MNKTDPTIITTPKIIRTHISVLLLDVVETSVVPSVGLFVEEASLEEGVEGIDSKAAEFDDDEPDDDELDDDEPDDDELDDDELDDDELDDDELDDVWLEEVSILEELSLFCGASANV